MSSRSQGKQHHLVALAVASASFAAVACGVLWLLREGDATPEKAAKALLRKPPPPPPPPLLSQKGFAVSISIANIIMWNPSTDPALPTFAFHPESLRFLTQLLQSPLRPTVTLIATVSSKEQENQIMHLFDTNGLFSKGLDERRVLFCDTIQGRVHLVKHLNALVHVDDNDQVLVNLIPHVKRLIRVKRKVKVSIEADIRRMSQSSVRSAGRASPPPRPLSPWSVTSSPETLVPNGAIPAVDSKKAGGSKTSSIVAVEDEEDDVVSRRRGERQQRPPSGSEYKFPMVSSPPAIASHVPAQPADTIYQTVMRTIVGRPAPTVTINTATPSASGVVESESEESKRRRRRSPGSVAAAAGGGGGAMFRTTSQASFKTPSSSIGSSLSRVSIPPAVVVDPVAETNLEELRQSGVVEFVEGIELSSLLM
ncbi:hypothetical protein HDU98_008916 [Podochytrium sp. JEL0797]|nr:hypothetical protein HDU98_008916 [Podochytrium sp. JEL0797]